MEKIIFIDRQDEAEASAFYVLEQTRINGVDYILVTASEDDEDGEALILKEVSPPNNSDNESLYEEVADETELNAVATVFNNLLEEESIILT
jgi:uncharacterized protein YrzB (UPF0473 family)